jgi:hypothetical protein
VKDLPVAGIAAVLLLKTFLARPGFDQRAIDREVFVPQVSLRLLQDPREKASGHFLVQQPSWNGATPAALFEASIQSRNRPLADQFRRPELRRAL